MFMIVSQEEVPIFQKQFDSLVKQSSINHSKNQQYLSFLQEQEKNPYGTTLQGPQMFDFLLNASLDMVE